MPSNLVQETTIADAEQLGSLHLIPPRVAQHPRQEPSLQPAHGGLVQVVAAVAQPLIDEIFETTLRRVAGRGLQLLVSAGAFSFPSAGFQKVYVTPGLPSPSVEKKLGL